MYQERYSLPCQIHKILTADCATFIVDLHDAAFHYIYIYFVSCYEKALKRLGEHFWIIKIFYILYYSHIVYTVQYTMPERGNL